MRTVVVRKNIVFTAIVFYIFILGILLVTKPHFLYNNDGSLRLFGVGYKKKTILPVWLLCIILGILSYYFVLYCLSTNTLLI
jgi:hypothetical protein